MGGDHLAAIEAYIGEEALVAFFQYSRVKRQVELHDVR